MEPHPAMAGWSLFMTRLRQNARPSVGVWLRRVHPPIRSCGGIRRSNMAYFYILLRTEVCGPLRRRMKL